MKISCSPDTAPDIKLKSLKQQIQSLIYSHEAKTLLLELIDDCEKENAFFNLPKEYQAKTDKLSEELSVFLVKNQTPQNSPSRFRSLLATASILVWLLFSAGACTNSNNFAVKAATAKTNIIDRVYAMGADQLKEFLESKFAKKAAKKSAVKGWSSDGNKLAHDDTTTDDDTLANDDTVADDDTVLNDDTAADDDTTTDDDTIPNDDTTPDDDTALNDDTVSPDDEWDDDSYDGGHPDYDSDCMYCPHSEVEEGSCGCE